ncbi:MAG: hypothetical protein VR72_04000 [Clostridiaceae bacterium BRH_c20a]|nr:MAG: hypothetical protein VR72_04000 [Clostridiaceae bacterium BRH_c20a]
MELFIPFRPMEPKVMENDRIFSNPKYIYEVKWDGIRGIIHSSQGEVKVFNKKMKDKTLQYPELQVFGHLKYDLILDGEIVVLKNALPSFPSVIRRDFAGNSSKIKKLEKTLPITYCIFDIILYNNQFLIQKSWQERQEVLLEVKKDLTTYKNIFFTENFKKGQELFEVIKVKKMEGIVAKDINSSYEIGEKTGRWIKIKYRRKQYCVVCGYTLKNHRPSALLLGVFNDGGQLVFVGRAGSGLTGENFNKLVALSKDLIIDKSPLINPPREKMEYIWLEPRLTILVEYAEWTEEMALRAPVIKGFTNVAPENCTF